MKNNKAKKDIALVLSGGGARGMAHIGVIEVLLERGYTITSIAGTSIGSLIAAVFISGRLEDFRIWVEQTGKLDVFRLMDFAISKNGFIKGEKIFKQIKKYVADRDIESFDIPFAAVAVDIKNHKEVIFRSGNLIKAIRASVSIPTVLTPITKDGIEMVDGGVLNPLPLDVVARKAGDLLIAVDLNADIPYDQPKRFREESNHSKTYEKAKEYINEKWSSFFRNGRLKRSGFFDLITNSIYAMQMKLTQLAIEHHAPDIVVEVSKESCDIFEFHRAEELIEYGKKQMINQLDRL